MATHHRNPASSRKNQSTQGRSQRPGLGSKRNSSHAVSSKANGKNVRIHEELESEEDAMAASFLQYCATCEKQIAVPSNSILYCSEGCRRKDNAKVLSYNHGADSPPMTPLQQFSFDDFPIRDIIPQRSPTVTTSKRFSYSSLSSDDSPYAEEQEQYSTPDPLRRYSEATTHLRQQQFQPFEEQSSTPRPRYNRSYTALSTISNAPSLSHSPTSTTGMSFPYTPQTYQRPLPSRINPFSTSYKDTRSIDLVNPFPVTAPSSLHYQNQERYPRHDSSQYEHKGAVAVAQTSQGFAEGEMMGFEKVNRSGSGREAGGYGSLKSLFRFSEMQAPPSQVSGGVRF